MPVKILDHITLGECASSVSGPYPTTLLADRGPRVINGESPLESAPFGQTDWYAEKPGFDTVGRAGNSTPPPLVGE